MTSAASKDASASRLGSLAWNPRIKTVAVAIVILVAVATVVFGYLNRPIDVQVAAIEQTVPVRVFGLGTVEAQMLSRIGFEVGATLVELSADHGDRVAKGQVLARLNLGEQNAKVAKARAALRIAEANIKRGEANLAKNRAVLAQKTLANQRKQALVGRDVVPQQIAEESVRDEAVANAEVAVSQSEVETTKAQLTDAQAQLDYEETMLRHRTLIAPYDALVIERHKEPGSVIKAGDSVFTLIAADSYWGLAYVDEARAGFIQEGQRVDARLRSRPQDAFTGRVVRIGLESDRISEERRVFIKGDNPPARVFLGEQAEFWITVARLDNALLVPEAAVQGYDGREGRVWTVESGRLQRRLVKFGHRTEDARLEIAESLPAGVYVISRTDSAFHEGRLARVIEARTK